MCRIALLVALGLLLGVTGCSSDGGSCALAASQTSASCAAGVEYEGHFYAQWSDDLTAVKAGLLGEGIYPACGDPMDCGEHDDPGRPTKIWMLKGVDPAEIVVARSEGSREFAVFARHEVDQKDYFRRDGRGGWELSMPRSSSAAGGRR
jgi:hypothetical protein